MRSEYPEHCKQKEIGNSLLQQFNNAKQANLHQNLGQISEQLALDWVKAILDKAQIGDETYYKQNTFKLSWQCDEPIEGPNNQQSSTWILILKAVIKPSKSRNWKKKSQNEMLMVKSTANCLNICYQTIEILILINQLFN